MRTTVNDFIVWADGNDLEYTMQQSRRQDPFAAVEVVRDAQQRNAERGITMQSLVPAEEPPAPVFIDESADEVRNSWWNGCCAGIGISVVVAVITIVAHCAAQYFGMI